MKFVLEIELGNEGMQTFADVLAAIQRTDETIDSFRELATDDARRLRDINGNTVGKWEVIEG